MATFVTYPNENPTPFWTPDGNNRIEASDAAMWERAILVKAARDDEKGWF